MEVYWVIVILALLFGIIAATAVVVFAQKKRRARKNLEYNFAPAQLPTAQGNIASPKNPSNNFFTPVNQYTPEVKDVTNTYVGVENFKPFGAKLDLDAPCWITGQTKVHCQCNECKRERKN